MKHLLFLRMKGLSPKSTKSSSLDSMKLRVMRHNLRKSIEDVGVKPYSHIDPQRIKDNIILRGKETWVEVSEVINAVLKTAKVSKWRKDTISAIELIFSLPSTSKIKYEDYFNDSVKWVEKYFAVPLVSAVIHLDEDAPHCHVILIPIVDGWLRGSDTMGNKKDFSLMHKDYYESVGKSYGIAQHVPQKRLSAAIRREAINLALTKLEANSGLHSDILQTLVEPHFNNPLALLQSLGLSIPQTKSKATFVGIMTKPCKPEKNAESANYEKAKRKQQNLCATSIVVDTPTSIEVDQCIRFGKLQPLSCVEVEFPEHSTEHIFDTVPDDYTRVRESDIPANEWDYERGEHTKETPRVSKREQVFASVQKTLSMRKRY